MSIEALVIRLFFSFRLILQRALSFYFNLSLIMTALEQIALLKRIDFLIQRKSTGTPNSFARRLEISRASLFRYLGRLRALGAPIKYSNARSTYYYQFDFLLKI